MTGSSFDDNDYSVRVVFVCTGNICRSPMAEIMFRDALEDAKLDDVVHTSSCGIGGWHIGQGADKRAITVLRQGGLDGTRHRAAQLSAADTSADLLVAMDESHVHDLLAFGCEREKIRLLRSFDPTAEAGAEVADPYYGHYEDFSTCYEHIQAAMPGLINWARTYAADMSER